MNRSLSLWLAFGGFSALALPSCATHRTTAEPPPIARAVVDAAPAPANDPSRLPELPQADALLDRGDGIETGVSPRAALRRIGAVAAGKISGAGSGTEVFLGLDGATTRVTVTVDGSGNRSAVAYA